MKIRITIVLLALLILSGCRLRALRKDLEAIEHTTETIFHIRDTTGEKGSIIFAAFDKDSLLTFGMIHTSDQVSLLLRHGKYRFAAYKDLNGDQRYQEGEPGAYFEGRISPDRFPMYELTLDSAVNLRTEFPKPVPQEQIDNVGMNRVQQGTVTTMNSPVFTAKFGEFAYWQPVEFIDSGYAGIYFLHEYDPSKIPVLFVHGASGHPGEFKEIVAHMDTTRFQPWFYFYPSGLRLSLSIEGMHRILNTLYREHGYKEMIMIAHSMGGLLTRQYIFERYKPEVWDLVQYITLSTPWAGHSAAAIGIEKAPVIVPSWYDMAPGSDFQEQLFTKSIAHITDYYALFSVSGGCSKYTGTNDGTVSIASQLRWEAQRDAVQIYGFNEDHTSILTAPAVINQLNMLMAEAKVHRDAEVQNVAAAEEAVESDVTRE